MDNFFFLIALQSIFIYIMFAVVFFSLQLKDKDNQSLSYYSGYYIMLCAIWAVNVSMPAQNLFVSLIAAPFTFCLLYLGGLKRDNPAAKTHWIYAWVITATFIVTLDRFHPSYDLKLWVALFYYLPITLLIAKAAWQRQMANTGDKAYAITIMVLVFTSIVFFRHGSQVSSEFNINRYFLSLGSFAFGLALVLSYMQDAQQKLIDIAIKDPLSGLLNRRGFAEVSSRQLALLARNNQHMALIVIDIDHFKKINDRFGHGGGDEAIKELANILKQNTRKNDIIMRYGGEEFCLLLSDASESQGAMLAEKLRHAIEHASFNYQSHCIHFTASFGVISHSAKDLDIDASIALADKALYYAKQNGRNRVALASELNPSHSG
ncbi:GGDEF domain-containing protein [Motilimonas pumila]|uniref:diguanylate cyclase n=1 Tax=Motilimonas pumila TaxID=2303987 RepID=A0A418YK28_9GAMM|nr:GGDEF domain-containing protein [Motilimonas pumila]RJG51316.1 GGDEF domain-containing protein [Motilimonas pumila]